MCKKSLVLVWCWFLPCWCWRKQQWSGVVVCWEEWMCFAFIMLYLFFDKSKLWSRYRIIEAFGWKTPLRSSSPPFILHHFLSSSFYLRYCKATAVLLSPVCSKLNICRFRLWHRMCPGEWPWLQLCLLGLQAGRVEAAFQYDRWREMSCLWAAAEADLV